METAWLIINIAFLILLLLAIVFWFVVPMISAPFHPSKHADIIKLFALAKLGKDDDLIDLGSGDGRVVLAASRICKSATGVEMNPFLTLWAKFKAIMSSTGRMRFLNKNFSAINLQPYEVVFTYLMPQQMEKLKSKFEAELAPGTRVVANRFQIKGWKASKKEGSNYYIYIIGEHR